MFQGTLYSCTLKYIPRTLKHVHRKAAKVFSIINLSFTYKSKKSLF